MLVVCAFCVAGWRCSAQEEDDDGPRPQEGADAETISSRSLVRIVYTLVASEAPSPLGVAGVQLARAAAACNVSGELVGMIESAVALSGGALVF